MAGIVGLNSVGPVTVEIMLTINSISRMATWRDDLRLKSDHGRLH
jgi:hypothetical protein